MPNHMIAHPRTLVGDMHGRIATISLPILLLACGDPRGIHGWLSLARSRKRIFDSVRAGALQCRPAGKSLGQTLRIDTIV